MPETATLVNAFYQTELAKQGFAPWNPPGSQQVFLPAATALLFCQRDKGIQLELVTYETRGKPTDVRLFYDANPLLVSCNQDVPNQATVTEGVLPSLSLPDNVVVLGTGSGAGFDGWAYTQREIVAAESSTDLDTFFRPQLQGAGWHLAAESRSDSVAWSKWTYTDAHGAGWSGVLVITAGQGSQNSRLLLFQIERVN